MEQLPRMCDKEFGHRINAYGSPDLFVLSPPLDKTNIHTTTEFGRGVHLFPAYLQEKHPSIPCVGLVACVGNRFDVYMENPGKPHEKSRADERCIELPVSS